jgi:hypothetical protein
MPSLCVMKILKNAESLAIQLGRPAVSLACSFHLHRWLAKNPKFATTSRVFGFTDTISPAWQCTCDQSFLGCVHERLAA